MKQTIRLTESELNHVVRRCINGALNEICDTPRGQYMLGRSYNRNLNRARNYTDNERLQAMLDKGVDVRNYATRQQNTPEMNDRIRLNQTDKRGNFLDSIFNRPSYKKRQAIQKATLKHIDDR